MIPRTLLELLFCVLAGGLLLDARASHAGPPAEAIAAYVVAESTAGDLNGDGDALDSVVHVLDVTTGVTVNLGLAVPVVCDTSFPPPRCNPVGPVVGDTIVAFLVSEASQGGMDLNGDGDGPDDVVYVYDAKRGEIESMELAVPHGITRSVTFITFPIGPVVLGDVVVFLVSEAEQGGKQLNHDGDISDAVIHLVSRKSKAINVALAAPRISRFFDNPLLVAEGDGNIVIVLAGEADQERDLNRDGDEGDIVAMEIRVHNGKARVAGE